IACEGRLHRLHGGRRLRCAVENRRSPARHYLRRHHDAASRRLSDVLADQAQQALQGHPGHHVVEQGRAVRPRARAPRRLGAISDEAIYEGRATRGDFESRRALKRFDVGGQAMALIMIVDDSPTEVHVMKTVLEKHGFDTVSAADGSECISLAREMRPDLILMDVVMPGVNGYQATRTLTRDPLTKSIPVVMITTKSQETDRIWGMRQGAVDYLVK